MPRAWSSRIDAQASASLDVDGRPRVRLREALVVEAAGLEQTGDRCVDLVFRVLAGEQAVATLGRRERRAVTAD